MGAENRKSFRQHIDLAVRIEMVDGSTASCVLLDLSQGGVRLRVGQPENLPEQFMLKLSKKLNRWSRIVWRSAEEVGVEFLDFPQVPAESTARRSVLVSCPKTGNNISTGIRLTVADDLKKMSTARRFTQCPYCKVVHGWTPSDAFLEAAPL
jgi:PilZ domain